MLENRFYKVEQSGGSFVTAALFNPVTLEEDVEVVRDYDYADCSRDNDELYYMEIHKEAERVWKHHHGQVLVGDVVEVVKGRKLPIGYTGVVKKVSPIYDRFGRWCADYVYFEEYGKRTNVTNVKIIKMN